MKSDIDKLMDEFGQCCRSAGLRVTPQRVAVYKALVGSREHPSAESLWRKVRKEMPNISFDTVNRTLLTLNEIGAAFTVAGTGRTRRFDGNTHTHQHFRCVKCRKIIDFHYAPFDKIELPRQVADEMGVVMKKGVYVEGLCLQCS